MGVRWLDPAVGLRGPIKQDPAHPFHGNLDGNVMNYWTDDVPQGDGKVLRRHLQFFNLDANTVRGPKVGIRRAEGSLFYRGNNADEQPTLLMLSVGILDIMKHCTCCHQIERPWLHRTGNDIALAQFKVRPTHIDQR